MAIKVCFLSSSHSSFDIRMFRKEAMSLAVAGYEVTIIAPGTYSGIVEGIKVISFPPAKSRYLRFTRNLWYLIKYAKNENAHIYHFINPEIIIVGLLLRLLKKKVIYDVLEDLPSQLTHKPWIPQSLRLIASRLFKFLEETSAGYFSAVIGSGNEITDRFEVKNSNAVTINNYPIVNGILETAKPDNKYIAHLGGACAERAAKESVTAIGYLPENVAIKLILAGRLQSADYLRQLELISGWEKVEYKGQVSIDEARAILNMSSIAIVLYSPEPNHYDVRSNRVYEAMAAGVPVITSNFPKWRELIESEKVGVVVDPTNPQELADAIYYLVNNPSIAKKMGECGRLAVANKYNWKREEEKLLTLYKKLSLDLYH